MYYVILATIGLIISGIGGLGGLKKENKKIKLISQRKLMIWSILSLVLALVNIVCLIYAYFSDFNS